MRPGRQLGLGTLAVLAAMLAAADLATAAPPPIAVEGLRVGLGSDDRFKVGTWTPIRVQLQGGPERFEGFMDVVTPDDDGAETVFRKIVDVPAGSTQWIPAYVRPGTVGAEIAIRMRDARGRRRGAEFSSNSTGTLQALWADQMILATLGHPQGVEAIPNLAGFSGNLGAAAGRTGPLVGVDAIRPSDGLPGRPYGYDGVEAVIIDTNDADAMAALDGGRGEPLKAWVRDGGHLVVALGERWQRALDSSLADMLPARPTGRLRLDDLGGIEAYCGSTHPVPLGGRPVTVTKLEDWEARGGRPLDPTATPLVVRGPHGFGRVTVVALDVDQKPFSDWEDRAQFWVKAIDLRPPPEEAPGGTSRSIYQDYATDLSSLLRSSLERFQGVRLVPFGWVAFFIFLYILAIGPGDYFFLKKVLKRMELTWITFPTIVLAVSLLAYLGAYAVKGTDLRVNKIDALDIDQAAGLARGSTWLTVFSPSNRDYDVSIVPRPLGVDNAATKPIPASLPAGTRVVLSWFGVPETVFGGMNTSGRLGLSAAGYDYAPIRPDEAPDQPESLRGVRIPIWSTKSFSGRWSAPASGPVVEADLESVGTDRLAGTITNRLGIPLKDAVLAYGRQVYYDLGTIEPGGSVKVDLKNTRPLAGYLESLLGKAPGDYMASTSSPIEARADLIRALMFRDGGEGRPNVLASNPLAYLDLSGQLALDRPMLVAEVDGPAATLDLGGVEPSKLEQTTVLRVILPLAGAR